VLERRGGAPRPREPVTHVIAVRSQLTITGQRPRQLQRPRPTPELLAAAPTAPQNALELVEECTRLRRDNQRLLNENSRLQGEVDRLTRSTELHQPRQGQDDASQRFALLELD
jgi:hypothetical protein